MQLVNETSDQTKCTVTVTNIMYKMQGKDAYKEEIDNNHKIGKWIGKVHTACPNLRAFFIQTDDGRKFIGYDYDLALCFSEYSIFKGDVVLHAQHILDPWSMQHNIVYPLIYFCENKGWPPCSNWRDGDPLNCAPFLIWNGYGHGPVKIDRMMDNSYRNLVILKYPNGVTKVANRFMYLRSFVTTYPCDPLTNAEVCVPTVMNGLLNSDLPNDTTLPVVSIIFR